MNIFASKWKEKYELSYCNICECIIVVCPECKNTTCNAGSCSKCYDDFDEFNGLKNQVWEYLSEEEYKVIEKADWIKKYIIEAMEMGLTKIDWQKFKEEGKLCRLSEEMFKDELLQKPSNKREHKV